MQLVGATGINPAILGKTRLLGLIQRCSRYTNKIIPDIIVPNHNTSEHGDITDIRTWNDYEAFRISSHKRNGQSISFRTANEKLIITQTRRYLVTHGVGNVIPYSISIEYIFVLDSRGDWRIESASGWVNPSSYAFDIKFDYQTPIIVDTHLP